MDDSAWCPPLRTFMFSEGFGIRGIKSHVSSCSLTSGYEEIRLGSHPIMDKNKSHIHSALCSPLNCDMTEG